MQQDEKGEEYSDVSANLQVDQFVKHKEGKPVFQKVNSSEIFIKIQS